jgi:hypothetical protein
MSTKEICELVPFEEIHSKELPRKGFLDRGIEEKVSLKIFP